MCSSLERVRAGDESTLECTCALAFDRTNIECVDIPDSVIELADKCFCGCKNLRNVKFGSPKLERICTQAFSETSIESIDIPDNIVELHEKCFYWCTSLWHVRFGISLP